MPVVMPEFQVGDRVTVHDFKYKGEGALAYIYGQTMIVRDFSGEYHRGLPLSSVTSFDSTARLRRNKFLQAFEQIEATEGMTKTIVSDEVPGALTYFRPDSETVNFIKLPVAVDNKELWLVISFNKRDRIELPATNSPKDIEIRHVRPFEIKHELRDESDVLVGFDRDKEQLALCERLELLLTSLVMQAFQPFEGTQAQCLEHVENFLGSPPTWFFNGDDILDSLPTEPGTYLCGQGATGRIYKLQGTAQICLYVDSRFSRVVKVVRE
jgi:hypothetical protein